MGTPHERLDPLELLAASRRIRRERERLMSSVTADNVATTLATDDALADAEARLKTLAQERDEDVVPPEKKLTQEERDELYRKTLFHSAT